MLRSPLSYRNKLALISVLGLVACAPPVEQVGADWRPNRPQCLAPAKPGGGFDLTCRLVVDALQSTGLLADPMQVQYKPGGVGAVAMAAMLSSRQQDADTIVAFSTGSLLNLAQGKFGRNATTDSVQWLAAAGVDYGALIVSTSSPMTNLKMLLEQLAADPGSLVFGAGGTVGSQDWMKSALVFRALEIPPAKMRYVAFEGGGDAMAALLGGHIDVMPGDMAETLGLKGTGKIRTLAVFSESRLANPFAQVPTAKEQGLDIEWPILRGFYLAPGVAPQQYAWWADRFHQLQASADFKQLQQQRGLLPLALSGKAFEEYVQKQAQVYRDLAVEFRLVPDAG